MSKLHTLINTSRRYSALCELKWLRVSNRIARKQNIPRYSQNEVRQIMVSNFGW